jgi:hypothetical protein
MMTIANGSTKLLTGSTTVSGTLTLTSGVLQLGANNLTIGASGSISGGSSSSHVVTNSSGKLIQNGIGSTGRSGAVLFPVGSQGGSYTPLTVTNSGTTDNYGVRVISDVYASYTGETPTGSALSSDVVDRTWFVTEGTSGGSNVNLLFQWNASNETTNFSRSTSFASHYNGSPFSGWAPYLAGTVSGSGPYTINYAGITSFSPFGVGDFQSALLPVDLVSFTGTYTGKVVKLDWTTASEVNNDRFDIERSADGRSFEKIGEVDGAGNSMTMKTYTFDDKGAASLLNNGIKLYYRLRQVDFDGKSSHSGSIAVSSEKIASFSIAGVQPNPFSQSLSISVSAPAAGPGIIQIVDMFGKVVLEKTAEIAAGKQVISLNDLGELKSAVYFVRMIHEGEAHTFKVVKE